MRPELLLPATLREVRRHLERLLSRLGLAAWNMDDRALRRARDGEWAWAPEPTWSDGMLPTFGRAAALLLGVAALVTLWLVWAR